MQAITICVNFSDMLAITLPRMLEHFETVTIVTDNKDDDTAKVADRGNVVLVRTDMFYKDGAPFDKGAVLDHVLDWKDGWVCTIDADVYLPQSMPFVGLDRERLYSPYRRLLKSPGSIPDESQWSNLPLGPEIRNGEYAGYCHIFHKGTLRNAIGPPPWYGSPFWRTAQGCDTVFWKKWGPRRARRLPCEVLHLGPTRVNWTGRVSPRWSKLGCPISI